MRFARVLIAVLLLGSAAITPVRADDAYRYWSYWNADSGTWQYAKLGPAMTKAVDGAIDGWRFGVGTVRTSTPPALAADFEQICGETAVAADRVRVAVVIDYGDVAGAPAPRAACAVISTGLTRASALAAVAPLRLDQGFVCGIDNYPSSGCGEPTTTAPSSQRASATASASAASPTPSAVTSSSTPTPSPSGTQPMDATASPEQSVPVPAASTDVAATEEDSLLPTIVTIVLAVIALLLAMRNARIQQEARRQ